MQAQSRDAAGLSRSKWELKIASSSFFFRQHLHIAGFASKLT